MNLTDKKKSVHWKVKKKNLWNKLKKKTINEMIFCVNEYHKTWYG